MQRKNLAFEIIDISVISAKCYLTHSKENMNDYSETMAENERKGGIAKGKKYLKTIKQAIMLFITQPQMTQQDIAFKLGVSQAFVSKYTSHPAIKLRRLNGKNINIDDDVLLRMLLKIDLDKKFLDLENLPEYKAIREKHSIPKI